MDGPGHYRKSEQLLDRASELPAGAVWSTVCALTLAEAQVHATLALAAATAYPAAQRGGRWAAVITS